MKINKSKFLDSLSNEPMLQGNTHKEEVIPPYLYYNLPSSEPSERDNGVIKSIYFSDKGKKPLHVTKPIWSDIVANPNDKFYIEGVEYSKSLIISVNNCIDYSIIGPMGKPGYNPDNLNYCGYWESYCSYYPKDVVEYNFKAYVCKRYNRNKHPYRSEYWKLLH